MWWRGKTVSGLRLAVCGIFCVLLLTGCGFTPLYGGKGSANEQARAFTNRIEIDVIPDREGQYLRNRLIDLLHDQGAAQTPTHRLTISPVKEERTDLDITKSADATRAQLVLRVTMTLTERATNRVVVQRALHSTTSFNILSSQFTTRVTQENARKNALDDLARQIEQQILLVR
jgi:LPS-assembly lipoprotein